MGKGLTLSIDAMGGDDAPRIVIDGLQVFAAERPDVRFMLHGDEAKLTPALAEAGKLGTRCEIAHTSIYVPSDMKPGQALRKGKNSSMWNAVEAVKLGHAGASVSAGNTGALMAMSMLLLRKMEGVHRPGMTALWPTLTGRTVVLDVGANLEASGDQLVTYAIMGEAFARAVLGTAKPRIGVLNVGSEDMKGHDEVRRANEILGAIDLDIDYKGFVEGDDISTGVVDVVVTDGFSGNIALKTGEGVARLIGNYVREALTAGLMAKAGAALASGGLKQLRARMDPSNVNGGVLLGLNGVSVKSHGGTDARGFATACRLAADLAASDYGGEISANLARIQSANSAAA